MNTYKAIRKDVNRTAGYKIMRDYGQLLAGKKVLRPPGITISEDGQDSFVPMQATLEKTVERLLLVPKVLKDVEALEEKHPGKNIDYTCYFKAGCDGMSGLIQFHQQLDNGEGFEKTDGKLLSSHLVLLQIVAFIEGEDREEIVFTNVFLNSPKAQWSHCHFEVAFEFFNHCNCMGVSIFNLCLISFFIAPASDWKPNTKGPKYCLFFSRVEIHKEIQQSCDISFQIATFGKR